MEKHFISIWFFIGLLLGAYGALILGAGVYELFYPSKSDVAMAHLHMQLWWGVAMLALGVFYVVRFRPGK